MTQNGFSLFLLALPPEIMKAYNPKPVESGWYEWWQSEGHFSNNTLKNESKPVFSMLLPPPNVTGTLHLGHALTCSIQDVLARW
jgi:valyl-tRNA synthetase